MLKPNIKLFTTPYFKGLVIVLLLSLLATINVWSGGFYDSHDSILHTARIASYTQALREGQFPPSLAPHFFANLGYPIFVYIYPLPYLSAALLHLLGIPVTLSFQLIMSAPFILSAVFFYLFVFRVTAKSLFAVTAATIFTWGTYRLSLLYVRGAFAESFAYLFIPLIFIAILNLVKNRSQAAVGWLGLALAGLLLSHQLVAAMFLPVIVWFLIYYLRKSRHKLQITLLFILSLILAFAVSAFIYLPVFFEKNLLHFASAINYYQYHLLELWQVFISKWDYYYSNPGTENDGMPFQLGWFHLAILFLALFNLIVILLRKNDRNTKLKKIFITLFWSLPIIVSIFIMLDWPVVHWLWQLIPYLRIVDFPWRFLGVTTVLVSLLYVFKFTSLKPGYQIIIVLGLVLINVSHLHPLKRLNYDDNYFDNYQETGTAYNEFLPVSRKIEEQDQPLTGLVTINFQAAITPLTAQVQRLQYQVDAPAPTKIIFPRLYFPGWHLSMGKTQIPITPATVTRIGVGENTQITDGLIMAEIPAGKYFLSLIYTDTPWQRIGLVASLLGILTTLFLILPPRFKSIRNNKFSA
jgi:hypothetical protein